MPYKDPNRKRLLQRERQRRCRQQYAERYATFDAQRRADMRALILEEKLRRARCFNPDCPLGGLAVTPDNACAFDFDHRDRSDKRVILRSTRGRSTILAEMAKCDLLCAFCHRLKTKAAGEYWPVLSNDARSTESHPTLFDEA